MDVATPWHFETGEFGIRKLTVGPYENNVYVVACKSTGEAVIVDAAAESDRILAAVSDVTPTAILTTHGHADHIGAAAQVSRELDIPFRLHAADAEIAGITPDEPLAAETILVGEVTVEARPTPGHTPGSTSFVLDRVLLSGDTLFPGGPGATRFPYSDFDQIIHSISTDLFALDDRTIVMPGHGLDTTIGTERPALDGWVARGW